MLDLRRRQRHHPAADQLNPAAGPARNPDRARRVERVMTNPLRRLANRWTARRLERDAAAKREIVHLLMPYPTLQDARDQLADVVAIQEARARLLRDDQAPGQ